MKYLQTICILLLSCNSYSQDFVKNDRMYIRKDVTYVIDTSIADTLELYDPVDRKVDFVMKSRNEISKVNDKNVLGSAGLNFSRAELEKFEKHIMSYFTQYITTNQFPEGSYVLHICNIVGGNDGRVVKYNYYGLSYYDDQSVPRDLLEIDAANIAQLMNSAPLVYASSIAHHKVDYFFFPEVIIAASVHLKKDKTFEVKKIQIPSIKHRHPAGR